MGLVDKVINIADGPNQVVQFASVKANQDRVILHVIARGLDSLVKLTGYEGNAPNKIDTKTNLIVGDDIAVPMEQKNEDCDSVPVEFDIDNGNYLEVVDSYFGSWGEFRIDNLAATTGTLRFVITTHKR